MNKVFKLGIAAAGLWACFTLAQAAPEVATETRPIDARVVRVKLDGAVDLRIRQGSTPTLTLSGDPRWLAKTVTVQSGDTLNIDTDIHGRVRLGSLHAELTLPALREVSSESVGSTDVSGFSGEELELSLDGAGSMRISCNYKLVSASLGGIGSMHLQSLSGEGVDLNLRGAGFVTLHGRAKWLKADLGGLGSLDAKEFVADNVNVELTGLGNASVTAHQNANLNLSGMGSVTVYGKVSWK